QWHLRCRGRRSQLLRHPRRPAGAEPIAHLAAMLPNPRYYQTHRSARGLLKRQAVIERRMRQVLVPR
ncbi:MAG: hypothetical protein ACK4TK_08415, partial [Thiobacillaceae bacterium]